MAASTCRDVLEDGAGWRRVAAPWRRGRLRCQLESVGSGHSHLNRGPCSGACVGVVDDDDDDDVVAAAAVVDHLTNSRVQMVKSEPTCWSGKNWRSSCRPLSACCAWL